MNIVHLHCRRGKAKAVSILGIAVLAVLGCKPNGAASSNPGNRQADNAVESSSTDETITIVGTELPEAPAIIPLRALESPGNQLLAAATEQNWDSERVAVAAGKILNTLGERIVERDHRAKTDIAAFVAQDVVVGRLRPAALSTVFEDSTFTVLRTSPVSKTTSEPTASRSVAMELDTLGNAFVGPTPPRYEQKVTRVELLESEVKTRSLVHLSGDSSDGNLQINFAWECLWLKTSDGALRLRSMMASDYEEIHTGPAAFTDCTQSVLGKTAYWQKVLSYSTDHWLDRLETRHGLDPSAWQGLAVGDANNDGLDDVYVCQAGGIPNGLLLQRGDGTVEDVATVAGVDLLDQTQSALLVDLDNDGDQDLVVAISMGITVLANDGHANFTPKFAKLIPGGMPYSLSAADYDLDGDLDVYACCYSKRKSEVEHRFLGRPIPYHDANNGARNALFRNNGQWQFQDVTKAVGLSANNSRFSFAASWEDYDNDGDSDLYVANDYGRNNLYRNDGGSFVDVAAAAGLEDMSAGMSVSWGDVDNDGWMDLYVSNMFSSAGNRVTYQRQFKQNVDAATLAGYRRHARGNSMFINSRNGKFSDVSESANVTMGRWAWGSTFVDFNNDGLKDIFVANGFLTQEGKDDL